LEEVLNTTEEDIKRKEVQDRYTEALTKSLEAHKNLEEALRNMHRIGEYPAPPERLRFSLDNEREGATHKFELGSGADKIEGYITSGTYSDGTLGEIFIVAEKQGSFVSGLMDSFATVFSIALQSGVSLDRLINKFRHTRFEPAGYTQNPDIRNASSILDYLVQWLDQRYNQPKEDDDGESGTTDATDE
jgi:ribonucleoside-diphosphate reductase alpha chain